MVQKLILCSRAMSYQLFSAAAFITQAASDEQDNEDKVAVWRTLLLDCTAFFRTIEKWNALAGRAADLLESSTP